MFEYNRNDTKFLQDFEDFVKQKRIENLIRIVENADIPRDIVEHAKVELRVEFNLTQFPRGT